MVAAVVFQSLPAGIGCWLEGLALVSALIIITARCNSHANHSSEQRGAEGGEALVRNGGPLTGTVGAEYFQESLIGPFIPTSHPKRARIGTWLATAGRQELERLRGSEWPLKRVKLSETDSTRDRRSNEPEKRKLLISQEPFLFKPKMTKVKNANILAVFLATLIFLLVVFRRKLRHSLRFWWENLNLSWAKGWYFFFLAPILAYNCWYNWISCA